VTVGDAVTAPRVSAELVTAGGGGALTLLNEDGIRTGGVALPRGLIGGGSPAWSPDGRQIAFTAATGDRSSSVLRPPTDVYVVSASGGPSRRVTTGRDAIDPAWSSDGRWIAYSAVRRLSGRLTSGIWIVRPDGSGARDLTPTRPGRFDLAGPYNPVTDVIAFTRCAQMPPLHNGMEPDTCGVWTMKPDGSDQHQLAVESESPAWSPDGLRIVFASARDHVARIPVGEDEDSWVRQLYVMDADGSHQHRLLSTTTSATDPSWAPGGAVIAYRTTTQQLFRTTVALVNADGSCLSTIPPPPPRLGDGYLAPAWRPGGVVTQRAC
jgi:Tol biopolymer transport system component